MIRKTKTVKHGNERWQVDFGSVQGQRLRRFFSTEEAADRAIKEHQKTLKHHGDIWLRMTEQERYALMSVYDEVRRERLTLREVWDQYRKDREAVPVQESVSFDKAVDELKRRKLEAGKDERYVKETCKLLLRFAQGQEKRPINEFTAVELQEWFRRQDWPAKSTRKSNLGRFSSLWTVALKMGWVSENIVDRLEPIGKISHDPKIFSYETSLRLMACALANDSHKRVIAPLCLGLFAGMRPEEAGHEKFGWHKIDLKRGIVTVDGEVAKDGGRRIIHLLPTAIKWLKLAHQLDNPLPPVNERRLVDSICEMAGITHWPKDVLRKTAATHLYHHYKSAGHVVMELGNSVRILLKHYVDLVDGKTSKRHWTITPDAAKKELERIRASEAQPARSASETAKAFG